MTNLAPLVKKISFQKLTKTVQEKISFQKVRLVALSLQFSKYLKISRINLSANHREEELFRLKDTVWRKMGQRLLFQNPEVNLQVKI